MEEQVVRGLHVEALLDLGVGTEQQVQADRGQHDTLDRQRRQAGPLGVISPVPVRLADTGRYCDVQL